MISNYRTHLKFKSTLETNNQGQALGLCYTFGYTADSIEDTNCKKCLKKYEEQKSVRAKR